MAVLLPHTELDELKQAIDVGADDKNDDSCNKKDEASLFYGSYETQVSEGGEADLHKHYSRCTKNPGHNQFVPVNNFNISDLPDGYQDNDLVKYIKAAADLTVKVDVRMTSKKRPEFCPGTKVPYAFYNLRGGSVLRIGTGMVFDVDKWNEDMGACNCHKCQHSATPSKVWGEVKMYTAAHVVFDELEGKHTKATLFYDQQDSPVVTMDDWTVFETDIVEDRCWLECVTCDVALLDKLIRMLKRMDVIWRKVYNKYKSSRDKNKLTFIVSHPHGCLKQVSVGHWINRSEVDYRTKYTYTACTCPGSSGAHVYNLRYNDKLYYDSDVPTFGHKGLLYYDRHVHGGVNSEGTNYCGTGRDWP